MMVEIESQLKCECGGNIKFYETPNLSHYGKLACEKCGKWLKWVRHPEKEEIKRPKTSNFEFKDVMKYHNQDELFCFFCLRNNDDLGYKEVMTLDHIQEIDKGGSDSVENLQILCSACHKLKNWARLYMNWHYRGKE